MLILLFILGLLTGSFLNVCIHRIPRGESVVFPSSRCPGCGGRLGSLDLIPVVSYFLLRGRCRYCGMLISPRYLIVELLTPILFLLVYNVVFKGVAEISEDIAGLVPVLLLLKYLFLTSVLIVVTFTDLEHYLIPNKVVLFALVGGVVINLAVRDLSLISAVLGTVSGSLLLLVAGLLSKGGVGGGDIKLAAVIGLFLGWPAGLLATFLAACFGGAAGLFLISLKKKSRKDVVPFAPFMALGAVVTMLWGDSLINWYLIHFF